MNQSQGSRDDDVLGIPKSNVVVFDAPVDKEKAHGFGAGSPANVQQWRTLLGEGSTR